MSNPLIDYFESNSQRVIFKWRHYFDIYHRHFARFIGQKPTVLEIGVWHGGSLQMWKSYFGEGARIVGMDIDPRCKQVEEPDIEVFIGDQSSPMDLQALVDQIGPIDILIDDGGHKTSQQILTFETMFRHITPSGIYMVEDTHSAYYPNLNLQDMDQTFLEYTKPFIEHLQAYHTGMPPTFASVTDSITYYDSIFVVEKALRTAPETCTSGKITL